jgi:hypothetical protein
VVVLPDRELVVVHLGKTPTETASLLDDQLVAIFGAASA